MVTSLNIKQLQFLQLIETLHDSSLHLFRTMYPVTLRTVIIDGKYNTCQITVLNTIGDEYKKWKISNS